MRLRIGLASIVAFACASCINIGEMLAPTYDVVIVNHRPDPIYEDFAPQYVELCAVSQYRPKNGNLGGIPGHGVMYLKGACLDQSSAHPRLVPCGGNVTDRRDPRHGTGISVNKYFKNINWIGIPGKRLFFHGNLRRSTLLDRAHFDATVRAALPYYRNVELHPKPEAPDRRLEEFISQDSIGTDFALRFGRSVFCTRMVVTEDMMRETMDFLNGLNAQYFEGEVNYHWSGFHDNCVHALRNALAAAKVWKPKKIWRIKLRQFFNLAIPANEVVNLAALGNDYPLENFPKIYNDDLKRDTLLEQDWLPMEPGVLIKAMSVHLRNDLYDTRYRLMVAQSPVFSDVTRKANDLLTDARFVELEPNLRYYRERYGTILENRDDSLGWWSRRDEDYLAARERYYAYIEERLADVDKVLDALEARDEEY